MGIIEKRQIRIPLEGTKQIDDLFFRQIQMDGDKVLKKFETLFQETKKDVYACLSSEGMFQSFSIEERNDDSVVLEGGKVLWGEMTSRVLKKSDEVVICAVTIHGYEQLEEKTKDFMRTFFYDGWGTAFAEYAFSWIKCQIKDVLLKKQIYSTCSWSPGQHNVDIQMQKTVFDMLQPEEMGITLNDSCMMQPKKSISGFFGIGAAKNLESIRACDFCQRRDTCPSAYATAK